ncbi:hypothetical protein RvY_00574 [Ramazzottius varieornatus]|uniref:Uncharacterized protein n=1 Tax=Ramazzottius varieornatus TaxID=947166 RepID=A0A1D1UDQ8_RAMVA|nr:hypothetical protein RvY_00574 [Ramazzottius varieornatus]
MARQAPEFVPIPSGVSGGSRPVGIYYKLYRCSDGKLRLNLITEAEYLESKKSLPVSVGDVSSSTDAVCSHHHHHQQPRHASSHQPVRSAVSTTAHHHVHSTARQQQLHCVPDERVAKRECNDDKALHEGAKRQKREPRLVRSTVSVQSLINEYIPVTVPSVGAESTHSNEAEDPVGTETSPQVGLTVETSTSASSTGQSVSCCSTASKKRSSTYTSNSHGPASTLRARLQATQTTLNTALATVQQRSGADAIKAVQCSTEAPAIWNSWIYSVGQRFPMADMSVRQVLDILDSKSTVLEG